MKRVTPSRSSVRPSLAIDVSTTCGSGWLILTIRTSDTLSDMSFDLYFYTKKGSSLSHDEFAGYLTDKGLVREGEFPQWLYSNESTGVYFSFEIQPESTTQDDIEIYESFADFDNTDFTFNINFIRPNFFGLEAFPFVQRLMSDLDLFALDPQCSSDPDNPGRKTADEYNTEWSETNRNFSAEHFDALELIYFPLEKSDEYWRYNFHKDEIQNRLGDEYFVPSLILTRRATGGEVVTLSTWTEHIPNVFPPADYFGINRTRKKLFHAVNEAGVVSRERLMSTFGEYLERFDFKDCYIIHPDKAAAAAKTFNSFAFDRPFDEFFSTDFDIEHLTNAERSPEQRNLEGDN